MLRASFWLTALIFMPTGLFLYFLPPSVAALVGVSPLWLARFSGGLLLAWGAYQLAASFAPDAVKDPNEKTDGKPGMGPPAGGTQRDETDPGSS